MAKLLSIVVVVLLILCLVVAALCLGPSGVYSGGALSGALGGALGGTPGAPRKRSPAPQRAATHIVVDTLNLAHWLRARCSGAQASQATQEGTLALSLEDITSAIDRSASALRARFPDRVMYVLKDRETQFNAEETRDILRHTAERNKVYIFLVERYQDPPSGTTLSTEHSSRARDDFLMALLASHWKCPVLSEDRLRDFDKFRANVSPFHFYEFAYWRKLPMRDFIRPSSPAYTRLRKPKLLRHSDIFGRHAEKVCGDMPGESGESGTSACEEPAPMAKGSPLVV